MEELITESLNDYEKLAIELANNKNKLTNIKRKLKENVKNYTLFNTELYCKNLENAYKRVYDNYFQGKEPQDFLI